MNEELKTLKQIDDMKYRVPISELKLGDNYKNVTKESIESLKRSFAEEIKYKQNPQLIPILTDARIDHDGEIIGGFHQYFAIEDGLKNGFFDKDGNRYEWPYGDRVWVEPRIPNDNKHKKILALKHNTQYDIATTERLAEYGADLVDSEYALSDIPVITDYQTISLLDVMDEVSPSDKDVPDPTEKRSKTKMIKVNCPFCEHSFETEVTL